MGWKISRINPSTLAVTMISDEGDSIDTVIPAEHRISKDMKSAYLKAQTDAHDAAKAVQNNPAQPIIAPPMPPTVLETHKSPSIGILIAYSSLGALISLMIFEVLKHL